MLHLRRGPPGHARHKEVGKIDALCGQRRDGGLQSGHLHIVFDPRAERLDRLRMRLDCLEAGRIVDGERRDERAGWEPRDADVFIQAHRVLVVFECAEPQQGHEVALWRVGAQ
eukprot:5612513-Prymnesium_polylepis.1